MQNVKLKLVPTKTKGCTECLLAQNKPLVSYFHCKASITTMLGEQAWKELDCLGQGKGAGKFVIKMKIG